MFGLLGNGSKPTSPGNVPSPTRMFGLLGIGAPGRPGSQPPSRRSFSEKLSSDGIAAGTRSAPQPGVARSLANGSEDGADQQAAARPAARPAAGPEAQPQPGAR